MLIRFDRLTPKIKATILNKGLNRWLFLGRSYIKLMQCQDTLGQEFKRIPIGEYMNQIAWELRQKYIDWISEIGRDYWPKLNWWISTIGDKNTAVSPLFLNFCQLELIRCLAEEDPRLVIVCEELPLLLTAERQLNDISRGRFQVIVAGGKWVSWYKIYRTVRFVVTWLRFIRSTTKQFSSAKNSIHNDSKLPVWGKNRPIAVIHTCIDESCMKDDGTFNDRYFPGLEPWLQSKGYNVVILPFPYQIKRSLKSMFSWFRSSKSQFLLVEDFLTIWDYLKSSFSIVKLVWFPKKNIKFNGLSIKPLIEDLKWAQASKIGYVRFVSYKILLKKLAKQGWNIKLFVDKFENMPKEKPQITALKTYFPDSTIIGYQHTSLPPFMLKYSASTDEFSQGVFPHRIVTNGPWFTERLSKNGIPAMVLRTGPSLRSGYLFSRSTPKRSTFVETGCKSKRVLVVLGLEQNICLELLTMVLEGFTGKDLRIDIKPHPMMDREYILSQLKMSSLPANMNWVTGPIKKWFEKSCCVVGMATGVLMEAVSAGVPVIVVGSECGLDLSPLGWWTDQFPELKPVYSPVSIYNRVFHILSENQEKLGKRLKQMQNNVLCSYQAVNDESMNAFLP